jgi:hypothetical protein
MGKARSMHGEKLSSYRVFVGKPEGKISLGSPRCIWEDRS